MHKKCHKVVRKPCQSLQQQQQLQNTESQTIDRNGDQQLDSFSCGPATHLEDESTESPIIEERGAGHRKRHYNMFICVLRITHIKKFLENSAFFFRDNTMKIYYLFDIFPITVKR